MIRLSKLWVLAAATLLAACSTESGGPRSITVGAELQDGSTTPAAVCVRMPVLLGSQVEDSTAVGSAFQMDVRALRHSANITFPNARNAASAARTVSLEQLENGYADSVSVTGQDGATYSVQVISGCKVTQTDEP